MIVVIIAVLAWFFVGYIGRKNSIEYGPWNGTYFMMGAMKGLITPEYVASKIGATSPRDEVLLRTDWQFDDAMVKEINMPGSIATPNKDGWGSLYYIICDFNNDGKVPNPELLTVPPKPGATQKELSARMVIFSAGKDGDPATWEDNQPPYFTK
ncbi:hypothetical protein [Prosthecobacter sp.]|uniref:hypothetical protein n=1 Tax=Prosthecobacter sp. TaxID=1965333 RepID=UPI0037846C1A